MKDFKLSIDGADAEFDYEMVDSIANNVYLSLRVRHGSFFVDPDFGSRLHTLKKVTDASVSLAKSYCDEALKWIVDTGRAESISVDTYRSGTDKNRINIKVTVTKAAGDDITYDTYYEVV